jgi:hypothetical protein
MNAGTGNPGMSLGSRRRRCLVLGAAAAAGWPPARAGASGKPLVEVWKSPDCGCCTEWVKHLQAHGFEVRTFDTGNTDARARLGMPVRYGSCHTGRVGGYAVEGHVPARELHRLLKERPDAVGLAVPAMPIGSPGMDGPEYGSRRDPYDVLLVRKDGSAVAYQSYR